MTPARRVVVLATSPLRFLAGRLAAVGPAVSQISPENLGVVFKTGRHYGALAWRKSVRLAVALAGLGVFLALQYQLGRLITAENWFQVGMVFVAIITVAVTISSPPTAFVAWLALSPWVALFWRESVAGALFLSFDRVALMMLLIVVIIRILAKRWPMRRWSVPEILLFGSYFYVKVLPHVSERLPIIYGLNVIMESLMTPFVIYLVAKLCVTTKKQISAMSVVIALSGLAWALSGWYEHFTGKMWLSPIVGFDVALGWRDVAKGRATGPSMHYYVYGGVLILTVFLLFHLAQWTKRASARLFYHVGVVATIVGLYFGYTRAPYIALAVTLVLAPWLARYGRSRYILVTAVIGIIVVTQAPSLLQQRDFAHRLGFERLITAAEGRRIIYQSTLNMIRANFWFGVGAGKSPERMPEYVSSLAHPSWEEGGRRGYAYAHNEYLVFLAEQGVIGFVLYFGAVIGFFVKLIRIRRTLPDEGVLGKDFVVPTILALIAYLILGNADQFQLNKELYYYLWTMIALVVRLGELTQEECALSTAACTSEGGRTDADKQGIALGQLSGNRLTTEGQGI